MCYSALIRQDLKHFDSFSGAIEIRQQLADSLVRVFPGNQAAVLTHKNSLVLMRYGTFPPDSIQNPNRYTSYNARFDNLKSHFWSNAFMVGHGMIHVEKFFEWVAVKDLISAGVVQLDLVQQEFRKQEAARKDKFLKQNKLYKKTKAELTDPLFREITIEFTPPTGVQLFAPVIFSQNKDKDFGFAIVTNDPPPAIQRAGHDRCPIFLTPQAALDWLHFSEKNQAEIFEILGQTITPEFSHQLAA